MAGLVDHPLPVLEVGIRHEECDVRRGAPHFWGVASARNAIPAAQGFFGQCGDGFLVVVSAWLASFLYFREFGL